VRNVERDKLGTVLSPPLSSKIFARSTWKVGVAIILAVVLVAKPSLRLPIPARLFVALVALTLCIFLLDLRKILTQSYAFLQTESDAGVDRAMTMRALVRISSNALTCAAILTFEALIAVFWTASRMTHL
jgi:hypothetical protein